MANFWHLPKDVREKIYRMHLIQDHPVTYEEFFKMCGRPKTMFRPRISGRGTPQLMQLCRRAERETCHIYFGENTFELSDLGELQHWQILLWPRHLHMIRKLILGEWLWFMATAPTSDDYFMQIGAMKSLQSLTVRVDERKTLHSLLKRHPTIKWHSALGYGPQIHMQLLRLPGIIGFSSLRGLREVDYLPPEKRKSGMPSSSLGAMPGDLLGTIRHEIMRAPVTEVYSRQGHFRFLDLPPELRNIIYTMLLVIPGITYPTTDKPTSHTSKLKYMRTEQRQAVPLAHSALDLLCANHQIHDEAVKLFYHHNNLVFSYPIHLQAFILSLGDARLDSLRSVTLFHDNSRAGGLCTMDVTLKLLRQFRGLQKFHLIINEVVEKYSECIRRFVPASLRGAKTLFTLRNIKDVAVRDTTLEDFTCSTPSTMASAGRAKAALRHFSRGLQVAQSGTVVKELFTDKNWHNQNLWPVVGGSECGYERGCSCGQQVREGEQGPEKEPKDS